MAYNFQPMSSNDRRFERFSVQYNDQPVGYVRRSIGNDRLYIDCYEDVDEVELRRQFRKAVRR